MKVVYCVLLLFSLPIHSQELPPPTIIAEPQYLGPHKVSSSWITWRYPSRQTYYVDGHDFRIDISIRVGDGATFIDSLWGIVMILPDRSVRKYSIEHADLRPGPGQSCLYSLYLRIAEGGWLTVFLAPVKELRSDLRESLYTGTSNRESHFLYIPKNLEFD